MDVLGRYRNLIVLVGVLFAQVLGLAVQVKRTTDSEPTRLIRIWAVGAVSPLEKVLVWVQTSTGNVWHNYFYLRGVRAENRSLKQQIERMSLDQVRMSQDADQARRLQALLAFKEQFISRTMAAQVIGSSGSELSRSVYIDKGESDGIKPDMAVITADGIVGKVLRVYRSTSQVLLIDDQTSGVGAILDKTRLQGILRGTPAGEVVLEKVMSDEAVPAGEMVLTSGGDGIFPKGLLVGRRSARISTARAAPAWMGWACLSSIFVTTSTSSSLLRSAAGRTRMLRKSSLPGATFVTLPTSRPLGKIPSPPLVRTISPAGTASSLITFSRTTSPAGVPRSMPCSRVLSRIAPTPLVWSSIKSTCEVERYTRSTLPTMPSAVMTAMSGLMPSLSPLSM